MSSNISAAFFRNLPRSPSLDHLRVEARNLKKKLAVGEPAAKSLVEFHLRDSGIAKPAAQLADMQFVVARSYGFKSWPRLKAFVESQSLSPEERGALLLQTLFTDNFTLLQELYERRDGLPRTDIYLTAALGDSDAVDSLLAADASRATQCGGPKNAQAIVYAAHARFGLWDETYPARQKRVVERLLALGADANSFAVSEDHGSGKVSALYGCCRYPGNPAIAQLLLNAGARTDDGESFYHASELRDTRTLELLFSAGIPTKDQKFCIRHALDDENVKAVAIYLKHGTNASHLDWALFRRRSFEIIRLLVEHGADVNAISDNYWVLKRVHGLTPVQIAERNGDEAIVEYLLAHGARDNRDAKDNLIGACAREDAKAARSIVQAHPKAMSSLNENDQGNLAAAARSGDVRSVELMLDAGFDIEARADDLEATALLYAATNGDVPMLRLLIRRGARLDVKHKYNGAPLGTAIYSAAHFRNANGDYAEASRVLIEAGEKPTDDHLKLAIEYDLDDIADILKANGASL